MEFLILGFCCGVVVVLEWNAAMWDFLKLVMKFLGVEVVCWVSGALGDCLKWGR